MYMYILLLAMIKRAFIFERFLNKKFTLCNSVFVLFGVLYTYKGTVSRDPLL